MFQAQGLQALRKSVGFKARGLGLQVIWTCSVVGLEVLGFGAAKDSRVHFGEGLRG